MTKRSNYYQPAILSKKRHRQKKRSATQQKISPKKIVLLGLFFSLLAALGYFFLFSSYWWIEEIVINTTKGSSLQSQDLLSVADQTLSKKYLEIISSKNILLAPIDNLQADLIAAFPQIASVKIHKTISPKFSASTKGSILTIEIAERQPVAIWCQAKKIILEADKQTTATSTEEMSDQLLEKEMFEEKKIEKCFYIDHQGIIYKKALIMEGGLILSLHDFRESHIRLGQEIISLETMEFILKIKEKLPIIFKNFELARGLGIGHLEIYSAQELNVVTSENWQIYFDVQQPADKQLVVLKRVLTEEIKENHQALEYIDLRIENRAYYK